MIRKHKMKIKEPTNGLVIEARSENGIHIPKGLDVERVYQVLLSFQERILAVYLEQKKDKSLFSDIVLKLQKQKLRKAPFKFIQELIEKIIKESSETPKKVVGED